MKNRIVAITVSTNYHDILPHSLRNNLDLFDHWYIATDKDDWRTWNTIAVHPQDTITVTHYPFKSTFTDPVRGELQTRWFDKGGAIRSLQERAYSEFPDHWYLVLDTDILLRGARDLNTRNLCPDYLYGPQCRLDYRSLSDYHNGQIAHEYFHGHPRIIGFFQLYKQKKFYQQSLDTNWCDDEFTQQWTSEQQRFLPITVDHLGAWDQGTPNTHRGRTPGSGFRNE